MISHSFYSAFLYLDGGKIYKGWSFLRGYRSFGELVFNTGMTGYQEIMTDPSYSGQMVVFTYPELGNTGLNIEDSESSLIHVKGIIAKNCCLRPSSWRNKISLRNFIVEKKIPHIFGIDTRALTYDLRTKGVMSAHIVCDYIEKAASLLPYNILNLDLVKRVTKLKSYLFTDSSIKNINLYNYLNINIARQDVDKTNLITIIVIDFGVKNSIISRLILYRCKVYVLPATTTYKSLLNYQPDGIILSNGPGDPSLVSYSIETIKKLVHFSNIPIFGICMGHQLLNLALGSSTFKLKFGHRGLNHPSGINQFSEITSQNHGFSVTLDGKNSSFLNITHLNLNDFTIGGITHNSKPIFSVQHHPEAGPGPHDSDYLFEFFVELVKKLKKYSSSRK
uniref:Carbamoyl phosphate synthase small chain n=1 Tax=Caloglossa intermedia TaxID=100879 RepID=A0A1Z1M6I6_9FLOR|nr:carbamoyl phosphate synthase small subunit [Caloglossa intermedia]ARW61364.1 carbamoyl phosphate synthase small subunit [Caloglossa intermedia]